VTLDPSSDLEDRLRARLGRELLYELQTGGGLALPGHPSASSEARLRSLRAKLVELRALFEGAPGRVTRWLGRPQLRILDAGAGTRPWSLAFARAWSDVRVTAMDLPDQLPATAEAVARAGLTSQYELVAADLFRHHWASSQTFDLILVANVCHLFDGDKNRALLEILANRLAPGGALAIIEQVLEDQPNWHRWAALYAMGVNHHAPGGWLFTTPTYFGWLEACGLVDGWQRGLCPAPPLSCVVAYRPPSPLAEEQSRELPRTTPLEP
jgi:SAM-dependent methyltransferase